jgi:hypothetical protein
VSIAVFTVITIIVVFSKPEVFVDLKWTNWQVMADSSINSILNYLDSEVAFVPLALIFAKLKVSIAIDSN